MRFEGPDEAVSRYLELRADLASARGSGSVEVTHRRADRCPRCRRTRAVNAKRRGLVCARCGAEWPVEELVVGDPAARRRGRKGGALSRARQGAALADLATLGVLLGRLGELERFLYVSDVVGVGGLGRIGELARARFPRHAAALNPREVKAKIEAARGRFARKLRRAGLLVVSQGGADE